MKLVVIYGPPATGKLTVAKELSKITGYKILHNHMTYDVAKSILEKEDDTFWDLNKKMRSEIITAAAKQKVNLIFTYCYCKGFSDKFMKEVIRKVKNLGGKVFFVQLRCDPVEREMRVKCDSRKEFSKVRSVRKLRKFLNSWEFFEPIDFVENLTINNTKKSAKKVAKEIKEGFKL